MEIPTTFPRVKDLFFNIGWKRVFPDVESELFLPSMLPWQPLLRAESVLDGITQTTPDRLSFEQEDAASIFTGAELRLFKQNERIRKVQLFGEEAVREAEASRDNEPAKAVTVSRARPDLLVQRKKDFPFPYLRDAANELEHNHPNLDERQALLRGGWNLRMDPTSRVQGPVFFGRDVQLRQASSVSNCMIGAPKRCKCGDCKNRKKSGRGGLIAHNARVERSLIRQAVLVDGGAYIAYSVIGSHVIIGAGVRIVRPSGKPGKTVKVKFIDSKGQKYKIDTGLTELGVVVGDHCKIGIDTKIHRGAVLMPHCKVPAGSVLKPAVYYPQSFL